MEPSEDASEISLKVGHMCMNRFCIDEDAAFESSGVHYLEKSSYDIKWKEEFELERKSKGKGYLSLK